MKQTQQMQEKMQRMREEIAQLGMTSKSGADLIEITINSAYNGHHVEIDPSLLERR